MWAEAIRTSESIADSLVRPVDAEIVLERPGGPRLGGFGKYDNPEAWEGHPPFVSATPGLGIEARFRGYLIVRRSLTMVTPAVSRAS